MGLIEKSRAKPWRVSDSVNPPLPCGMALMYLQSPTAEKIGSDYFIAKTSPRPTGMSSWPII